MRKVLFTKNVAHPIKTGAAGTVHDVPDDFGAALIKNGDAVPHVDAKAITANVEGLVEVLKEFAARLQTAEATIATHGKVLADLGVHDLAPAPEPKPAAEPTAGPFASA